MGCLRLGITLGGLLGVKNEFFNNPHKLLPHLNNATAFPLDEPEPSAASQPYGVQAYFNIKFLQVLSGLFCPIARINSFALGSEKSPQLHHCPQHPLHPAVLHGQAGHTPAALHGQISRQNGWS